MLFLREEGKEDPEMEVIFRINLNNSIINNLILSQELRWNFYFLVFFG